MKIFNTISWNEKNAMQSQVTKRTQTQCKKVRKVKGKAVCRSQWGICWNTKLLRE